MKEGDVFYTRSSGPVCYGRVVSVKRKVKIRFISHTPLMDGKGGRTRFVEREQLEASKAIPGTQWRLYPRRKFQPE